MLLAVDLDLGARVLAEQDRVARLDLEGLDGTVVATLAVTDGDDLALLGLLLRGVGDDDAALAGLLAAESLDDEPIVKGSDVHGPLLQKTWWSVVGDGAPSHPPSR